MKNIILKLSYLFIGLFFGYLIFWALHLVHPDIYHDEAVKEKHWRPKSIENDLPSGKEGAKIKYGHLLITKTSDYLGVLNMDTARRYIGNNLTCNNCHLDAGRKIGSGSFIGVTNRFPEFRPRENKIGTMEERINGCLERSMNGKPMPEDSEEMQAMISYMKWLSNDVPPDIEKLYIGYTRIKIPDTIASPEIGKKLYQIHCQRCHLEDGKGLKIPGAEFTGYIYPPLGGEDSFNDGSGMNRVLTAAQFIKANMPLGATYDAPVVTDDEAYHLAAYINTLNRPSKANKEADFPDKRLKPVSTPYGPWTDPFTEEQHKFGPFNPIIEYYKKEYNITKVK